MKLVRGEITKKDAEDALDMGRTGACNKLLNEAMQVIRDNKIKV